jgi:squalene synthase HpnC
LTAHTVQQLDVFGPDRCDTMTTEQARQWCMRLATGRYENFSVLSAVVPKHLRNDFAAVYAFCRWADDLGDEIGNRERSLELLQWWRRELQQCFASQPRHPVFLALWPTIQRHSLPIHLFNDLIRAFEQDQTTTRYETWDQLIDYCRLSASPVGRLVLMMCGESGLPQTRGRGPQDLFSLSDCICTGLQLTNHWQDVRRDMLERDRLYIPRQLIDAPDFEPRLIASARQGHGVDREFLEQSRGIVRRCCEKTWPLFERGSELVNLVQPQTRPIVWLLAAGGQHVLRLIHMWNYETALHRPKLSKVRRVMLVAQAWLMARRNERAADKAVQS